jgi:alpha-tubulin suppressor-like RCC1 family protein
MKSLILRSVRSLACSISTLVALSLPATGQVSAPVFTPMGGKASVGFSISVTCATPGTTIRYSTNGSTPALSDPEVPNGGTVIIPRSLTLKAMAWDGSNTSAVTSANYQVVGKIACGGYHAVAVKSNESVFTWGRRQYGALGDYVGTNTIQATPQNVYWAMDAAAGNQHSLWLDTGAGCVISHGLNTSGQLGINSATTPTDFTPFNTVVKSATPQDFLTDCVQVAAADTYSAALAENGEVYTWGANTSGRLGRIVSGTDNRYAKVVKMAASPYNTLSGIQQISCGYSHMLARTAHATEATGGTGGVWVWGLNSSGQLGLGNTTSWTRATQATLLADITDISAGYYHSAVVKWNATTPGRVFCFGQRSYGRLGNNLTTAGVVPTPVQVQKSGGLALEQIVSVATGPRHTLALDNAGNVWSWGGNANGELGDNTLTYRGIASRVLGVGGVGYLSNIVSIYAGGIDGASFSFATDVNGTIYAWGINSSGQLGLGDTTQRLLPTVVGTFGITNVGAPNIALTATMSASYEPVNVTLNATTTDPDGDLDVRKVFFYNGTQLLGTVEAPPYSTAPFSFVWTNAPAGNHSVKAVAEDTAGVQSTAYLSLTVGAVVGVQTLSGSISEDGLSQGVFRISRLNASAQSMLVSYTLGGTSSNGRDYQQLPLSATIPANQTYVDIAVIGKTDFIQEPTETVIIILSDTASQHPDPLMSSATATITDVTLHDADGLDFAQEAAIGTSPVLDDTDGDGVNDDIDPFPLDPDRWETPSFIPGDVTAPLVTLQTPSAAVLVSGP